MSNELIKLSEANNIAIESINKFLSKLNLNPDAFSHLSDVKIQITNYNIDNSYEAENNTIIINKEVLENHVLEVALTLVHELLHANRTIIINDTINKLTNTDLSEYYIKRKDIINEYIYVFEKKLTEEEKNAFFKYIPIKITPNDNNTFNVIAHNKITQSYEEFSNIVLNNNEKYPNGELFKIIGLQLNDKKNNYKSIDIDPNKEIEYSILNSFYSSLSPNKNNKQSIDDEKILNICDYFHPFNEPDSLENLKEKYISTRLKQQHGFEEVMVESIAHIIIMSRNDNDINLDKIYSKLEKSNTIDIDTLMGLKLIKTIGPDVLNWFMISCYDDTYYNMFAHTVKEHYQSLIKNFSDLYNDVMNKKEINQDNIDNIDDIISDISNKKSR